VETARSRTDACLTRIAERDSLIGAWAHLDPALARAQADARDAEPGRSGLHGLPIAIKDVLTTRDMPTGYGCALYAGHFPQVDAACVALLRQAGAVILGKTATVELASIGAPPRTRNPRAPGHTPGGSSSGSAAAVADAQVPIAIGTQTGGSIIRPASFCGVWALKPTWGSVSAEGAKPFAPSLDTIGWFGRDVDDLTLLLDILAPDMIAPPPPTGRIGIWRTAGWARAEPATRAAMASVIAMLVARGFAVEEMALPLDDLADVHRTIMLGEGRRSFLTEVRADADRVHPRIVDMVRNGPVDLRAAQDRAADARRIFDDAARRFDAILTPSTIGEAPRGLEHTGDLLFNGLFTLLHAPCVNLPLCNGPTGLPVGLTLTGGRGTDRAVLDTARRIAAIASQAGAA
jgi:Asp-tRNA(Asn)/Glu-tRNA(Gln) amidotransferase A subunit family amidase